MDGVDRFEYYKKVDISRNSDFEGICMQFYFKITQDSSFSHQLIFAKADKIIQYDFEADGDPS